MRTGAGWRTIGAMKRPRWKRHWKKRRSRYLTGGMEVTAALSAATQMALLCPPGFEEWVRRELVGAERIRPFDVPAHTGADVET